MCPLQESYSTSLATQLANDLESNANVVLASVTAKDGPVTVSGTQTTVKIVQVGSSVFFLSLHLLVKQALGMSFLCRCQGETLIDFCTVHISILTVLTLVASHYERTPV